MKNKRGTKKGLQNILDEEEQIKKGEFKQGVSEGNEMRRGKKKCYEELAVSERRR